MLSTALASAQSDSPAYVKALADAVDARYNRLHSLEVQFTELYRGSGMERNESGTLWLKKPGKMRWEYRSPKEKLFVSDGKTAWFYVPDDKQARKMSARKLEDIRSPLAFLLGKAKLQRELHGLSLAPDVAPLTAGDSVVRGVPEAMANQISEIVLEITPEDEISRIILEDVDGSSTEYRFTDERENVPVSDRQFEFQPPPGTEIVEDLNGP